MIWCSLTTKARSDRRSDPTTVATFLGGGRPHRKRMDDTVRFGHGPFRNSSKFFN